ncbi:MAG: anthranilate synthase component 1, partial [Myxococcota bacterium]
GKYRHIPVSRAIFSDMETPLAAFWKLKRGAWSFLLESVTGGEKWARYTIMGTEPRAIYRARGSRLTVDRPGQPSEQIACSNPLTFVTNLFHGRSVYVDPDLPRFVGGLVGGLTYDAIRWVEAIPDQHADAHDAAPDLVFMETGLVLIWDNLEHRAVLVYLADIGDSASDADIEATWALAQDALDDAATRLAGPIPPLPVSPSAAPVTVTRSVSDTDFATLVDDAREYIIAGDVIQVVLSRRFTQPSEGLHPFLVYRTLRGLNPSPYMFYVEAGDETLVGASPEVLVRHESGTVIVRPIAGTRRRGETPEEDAILSAELLADPKEIAEHVMLLDLGRNDIGRIAQIGSVKVVDEMVIERYSHVIHLVSQVAGTLTDGLGPAEVLSATFPAGTLSGAPKIRAMEIIDAMESSRRGYYGGAIGTIGVDGYVDLCIAIRTMHASNGQFSVQAGAGIVYDSVGEKEAEESYNKARAVLHAVDLARKSFVAPTTRRDGKPAKEL